MADQVVWFDMPVQDLDRAIRFYGAVLGAPPQKQEFPGFTFAILAGAEESDVSGCLTPMKGDADPPPRKGVLLYFNCQGRLDEAIAVVEPNGGHVLEQKHQIGPYGFRAVVLDSEGNRIALHSR
jgi:uncharacterized protein